MKGEVELEIMITKINLETGRVLVDITAKIPNSGEPIYSFPQLDIAEGGSINLEKIPIEISDV